MITRGFILSERVYVSRDLGPNLGKELRNNNPLEVIQLIPEAMQTDIEYLKIHSVIAAK